MAAGCFQQIDRSLDVHLYVKWGALDGVAHPGHGRQVDHPVGAFGGEDALHRIRVADVGLVEGIGGMG